MKKREMKSRGARNEDSFLSCLLSLWTLPPLCALSCVHSRLSFPSLSFSFSLLSLSPVRLFQPPVPLQLVCAPALATMLALTAPPATPDSWELTATPQTARLTATAIPLTDQV